MSQAIAHVNGAWLPLADARVSVLDRGLLFADGVYEVLAAYGGRPFALDGHVRRLARSLREIAIRDPHTAAGWERLVQELVDRNGGGDLSVYLQVTRGTDVSRTAAFPEGARPTVIGFCQPLPPASPAALADGVAVVTRPDVRWGRCDIKSVGLLPNVMAIQHAREHGCNEALFVRGDRVTEGASSNVFAVLDGAVVTPPLSHEILPGVTREVLLRLLRADGQDVRERDLNLSELLHAQEIWLASTVREVLPVTRLDGEPAGGGRPGPRWKRAWELFQKEKKGLGAGG
ncbi:MAG TPA: D-amino acid aminotransferase [Candidatus Binatia bacterium]|nr:D-amino acid aminotransferase [Candidatus Binatia bacterium]